MLALLLNKLSDTEKFLFFLEPKFFLYKREKNHLFSGCCDQYSIHLVAYIEHIHRLSKDFFSIKMMKCNGVF